MEEERNPLLEELERAKRAELKKLGNVPGTGSPLLAELDAARAEEEIAKIEKDPMRLLILFDELLADAEIKRVLDRIKGETE